MVCTSNRPSMAAVVQILQVIKALLLRRAAQRNISDT
jgi:hypothetical protein